MLAPFPPHSEATQNVGDVSRLCAIDLPIDHFRDIPMDSQTMDITHFAVVFHYDAFSYMQCPQNSSDWQDKYVIGPI